jgi:ppGpp synthetase/RelA/SpoT-type nucleotidyltranferase
MNLSQMQDIGGCRAVVASVARVEELHGLYLISSIKHRLARIDDYIENPQPSGYRGVRLIYRYFSDR